MIILFAGGLIALLCFSFNMWFGIAVSVIVVALVMLPILGFENPEAVEKRNLVNIRLESKDKKQYVVKKGQRVFYAFNNNEYYGIDGLAYEETYVTGKVKIFEDKDCNIPTLTLYIIRPYRLGITFAPFSTKKEYVFHVPEGTVIDLNILKS